MNSWWILISRYKNLIGFGFILTFFSGFGQTFLVSVYVPEILQAFEISNARFGSVYAVATLSSALCLPWLGRYIDVMDLRRFALLVVGGMSVSLLIFSQASHWVALTLGLWGIRLSGQGLMSHTAITSMGRYFEAERGKAISIASLGHPAGSALLPLLITFSIGFIGWRYSLLASAILVALVLPLLISYLLRNEQTRPSAVSTSEAHQPDENKEDKAATPSYKSILSSKAFWLIAPGTLAIPFLNTSFFFYQIALAEAKGWPAEWVAASFAGYAIATALCMILAGQLIDRYSAKRLFPFFLFPLAGALTLVVFMNHVWIAPVYLVLIGVSSGLGNPVKSAIQAEVFGVEYLGTVRSLYTALMVISTALGPAIFGFLLDGGLSFEQAFGLAIIYLLLTIGWNFRILLKRP